MNRNWTIILALAAGLTGGVLSRYIGMPSVHAQTPAPVTTEVRAQSFTLVDAEGRVMGTFTSRLVPAGVTILSPDGARVSGRSRIVLLDPSGREIWSADGSPFRMLSQGTH